jgi:hypothetical protein
VPPGRIIVNVNQEEREVIAAERIRRAIKNMTEK